MNVTLVDRGRAGQRQGCEQKRMPQKALLPKKGLMACSHPEKLFSGALTHKCSWCPGVFLAMHSISWLLPGLCWAFRPSFPQSSRSSHPPHLVSHKAHALGGTWGNVPNHIYISLLQSTTD